MGNRNSIAAGAPSTESAGEEVSQQQLISENAAHKLEERTQTIEQMGGIAAKDEKPYVSPTAGDDIAANVKVSAGETTWDRHYTDLIAYKQQHGHCNVPRSYKENTSLGKWVSRVRHGFKSGKLSD